MNRAPVIRRRRRDRCLFGAVRPLWLALVLLGASAALAATAAEVRVQVTGLDSDRGDVRAALCTAETFLEPNCDRVASVAIAAGGDRIVTLRFADVAPGRYAVQVFHDANDNGELDRNWLGWPREGMGFSRDAEMRRGPPAFDAAAVDIPLAEDSPLTIRMRYF